MTVLTGSRGRPPKRPVTYIWTLVLFLNVFLVGELILQKRLAHQTSAVISCLQAERRTLPDLPTGNPGSNDAPPLLATSPRVHEMFTSEHVVHWDNLTERAPKELRTRINGPGGPRPLPYGVTYVSDVCMRPNGTMVVVGTPADEIARALRNAGPAMEREWQDTYNCSWGCYGVKFEVKTPEGALWLAGDTTHIFPYLGNVFHHFAERVWPHVTGDLGGTPQYYVHRMHTWLEQAHHSTDRNTLMFQLGLLGRLAPGGAKFLQHTEHEARPLCFERLRLTCATCGRMSPKLGLETFGPAIDRYRAAAFAYFGVPEPEVALPPRPLRVTLYGRNDSARRRVANIAEVAHHLRRWARPPLRVTFVDELLTGLAFNQTLPEVVSLMAQTDVLITPHGANTWASLFLPRRSAVVEVYGPCGPSTWIANTIVPALTLKHKTEENPWGVRVASPRAGNTTRCESSLNTPDFTLDIAKLDAVLHSLRVPAGPGDRLPLYWLYDWTVGSY